MQTAQANGSGIDASDGIVWDADASCWSVSSSVLVRECLRADGRWLSSNFVTLQEEMFQSSGFGRPRDLTELSENVLTQQDGSYHDHIRAAVSPVFNRVVKAARPAFQELVDGCVSSLGDRFDLVADLADPIASGALAIVLNLPETRRMPLITQALDVLELLDYDPHLPAARMLDRVQQARVSLAGITDVFEQQILTYRPGESRGGLVSALCDQRSQPDALLLSNLEIVWQAVTTLMAGYVTTTSLISGALARLPQSPSDLLADKAGFRTTFEDLIRQAGPTRYVMRRVTADAICGGAQLREGQLLRLCLIDANTDAACLGRSDPAAHLAFGEGMHVCPGTSMAKLLLKTVLEALAAQGIRPQTNGDPVPLDRFQAVSSQLSWAASNRLAQ